MVIPDLPNDHYHAFADPMVVVILGLGAAAAWRGVGGASEAAVPVGRVLAAAGVLALCGWNLATQPPAVNPDGGFPAAAAAADRIVATTGDESTRACGRCPSSSPSEAYAYPLVRIGRAVDPASSGDGDRPGRHLRCPLRGRDRRGLWRAGRGRAPDDDGLGWPGTLSDRFEAAPGRIISVYRRTP